MEAVYFDHNATTPVACEVSEAMRPWMDGSLHGNPSSVHRFGQAARDAVEEARAAVAALLAVRPAEIVLTASGTEANNAVMLSCARATALRGHMVISQIEHPSVRAAATWLEAAGVAISRVAPEPTGRVDPRALLAEVRDDTTLVCLMLANNELGVLQPVAEVAAQCRARGVPVLCDAVQAVGKIAVRPEELGVDYLSLGAHKFYGPLGAAALWVRRGAPLEPLLMGGGQERHRRAGTENVPAVVGLGAAARLAAGTLEARGDQLAALRDRFERGLAAIGGVEVHGTDVERLPNTSHLEIEGVEAEALMIRLDLAGFAVSAGSACASGTVEPSATLTAIGLAPERALSSMRVSVGITNSDAEVDAFLEVLVAEVASLRRLSAARAGRPFG